MLSYADKVCFGIGADRDAIPDLAALRGGIESSLAELAA